MRSMFITAIATVAVAAAGLTGCKRKPKTEATATSEVGASRQAYNPMAAAKASYRKVKNPEAVIPVQCYTVTEGKSNPCWTCHTREQFPNMRGDFNLQWTYSFSDVGLTNQWSNLFVDRRPEMAKISDEKALAYVKEDNYTPLKTYFDGVSEKVYVGYRPGPRF